MEHPVSVKELIKYPKHQLSVPDRVSPRWPWSRCRRRRPGWTSRGRPSWRAAAQRTG